MFGEEEGGYQDNKRGLIGGLTMFSPVKPEHGMNDRFPA